MGLCWHSKNLRIIWLFFVVFLLQVAANFLLA